MTSGGRRPSASSMRKTGFCWVLAALLLAPSGARAQKRPSVPEPKLTAQAVLVLHNTSGKTLLARNAHESRPIASLTKLVATLVVRSKSLDLKAGTTIERDDHKVALGGCRTRLEMRWTYRNEDLLHAALMASDNRAVSALGRAVKLSANALVQGMNEYVRAMGLTKTHFRGPVGIDHGNKSTAWEMARIVRRASKDEVLSTIMAKAQKRVKPMRGYLAIHYRNTNAMVGRTKTARFLASKTGFNDAADYCLAAVAEFPRIGPVTFVLLGSKSKAWRTRDTRRVIEWVAKNGASLL